MLALFCVSAADGPNNGTSTAKKAQNAADGPNNGTSTAVGRKDNSQKCAAGRWGSAQNLLYL
jgi:hypothetical protein